MPILLSPSLVSLYSFLPRPVFHKQKRPCSVPRAGQEAGLGHIPGLLGKHQAIFVYKSLETLETFMESVTIVKSLLDFFVIHSAISL